MSRRGAILQDYGNIQNPASDNSLTIDNNRLFESRRQFNAENERLKKANKSKEGGDAAKFITELKNEKTGINDIDIENDKQLLAAQNRMIEMQEKGSSLQDIQIYAMRELPKINNAYTLGKNYKEQVTKGMVDMEKKYGDGVDLKELQNRAYKKMADDIFDRDEKGNIIGYKDPNLIPKNRDYISEIEEDDDALETVFKPSGALSANIKTFPTPSISKSEDKRGKDGRTRYNGYTGQGSVFVDEDIDPETGITKGLKYKSEKVPLGNKRDGTTNYIDVMPEDEFGLMTQTPAAKKEFDIMFRNQLKENNINPTTLDSRAKYILKRNYALEWVKETNIDGSAFNPKMKDIQPLPPRTTINNRFGGDDTKPIDVYTPIADYFANNKTSARTVEGGEVTGVMQSNLLDDVQLPVILDKVRKSYPNVTPESVYLRKFPDGIWAVKSFEDGKISTQKDIPVYKITKLGSNLIANETLGNKAQDKVAKGENKKGGYTYNGYDYTEDEINQAAAAEKLSKDAYLKKHGIKKK